MMGGGGGENKVVDAESAGGVGRIVWGDKVVVDIVGEDNNEEGVGGIVEKEKGGE